VAKRDQRLARQRRFGTAAEKVAENVLEGLFTMVLDWHLSEVNNQVGYADMVLTRLGVKHLIVEVKRPGSLAWNQHSVDRALTRAHRYADEQNVRCVAVSDGIMLYARDHIPGAHRDRLFVRLDQPEPPCDLWWLARLPKAIQVIFADYRGAHLSTVPESAIPGPCHPRPHRPQTGKTPRHRTGGCTVLRSAPRGARTTRPAHRRTHPVGAGRAVRPPKPWKTPGIAELGTCASVHPYAQGSMIIRSYG
jgi:hypothetical protein